MNKRQAKQQKKPRGRPRVRDKQPPNLRHLHIDRHAARLLATDQSTDDEPAKPDDLLTTRELAAWFNCTTTWLENGRREGYGPPFLLVGPNMVRYQRGKALDWLGQREFLFTSQYKTARKEGRI
jgi:hypothetical protein